MEKRKLCLDTGPLKFFGAERDKPNRAVAFFWMAETEVPNIILMRIIVLRLRWPPIKWVTMFTDRKEYEDEPV